MDLGYEIAAALPGLRAQAESRMTETVTIGVYTDATADDGSPTREPVEVRYTGKARVRYVGRAVLNTGTSASGTFNTPFTVQEPYLSIPVGSPVCYDGDEVEVTASADDGIIVGRRFKIQGLPAAGQTTAHRYLLQELG